MRGLRNILERSFYDNMSIESAFHILNMDTKTSVNYIKSISDLVMKIILTNVNTQEVKVSEEIIAIENAVRSQIVDDIRNDECTIKRLSNKNSNDRAKFLKELSNIKRNRKKH